MPPVAMQAPMSDSSSAFFSRLRASFIRCLTSKIGRAALRRLECVVGRRNDHLGDARSSCRESQLGAHHIEQELPVHFLFNVHHRIPAGTVRGHDVARTDVL